VNEKTIRWILVGFCLLLLLGGGVAGWLFARANRRNAELELRIASIRSLADSYASGLEDLGRRYSESERERQLLDQRGRELEDQIQRIIDGLGGLGDEVSGLESQLEGVGDGVRGAYEGVSGVAGRIDSYLEEAEKNQNNSRSRMDGVSNDGPDPDPGRIE
jgi:chromosome segregation ATPase